MPPSRIGMFDHHVEPEEFEFVTLSAMDTTLQSLRQILEVNQIVTAEGQSSQLSSQLQSAFLPTSDLPPLVYPKSVDELRSLMTWANRDHKTVLVCGSASKVGWGTPIAPTDVIISTSKLDRVIEHAVGDLTITVQAGISFQTLQSKLQSVGQMLPVDPVYPCTATLGGILATRDAGSLRQRYGGVRDFCLGLSFVRADGELAKAGGRVVKNVAGYDLMKLFTGSFGSLGVLAEVTLRLYPMQETSQSVVITGKTEPIASLTASLLDSTLTPVSIDFLSQHLLQSLDLKGELGLAVRFQSLEESVLAQMQRLKDMGQDLAKQCFEDDEPLWKELQNTLWGNHQASQVIAKVGMLPNAIPSGLQQFQRWCDQEAVMLQAQVTAGWGIGTLRLTGSSNELRPLLAQLRQHCEQHQGYLSLLEAPLDLRQTMDVWGYPGNAIAPMRKLKQQFDPNHILNPGRFVGGI